MLLLLYQVSGNNSGIRTSFPANPQQPLQFLMLFFDQLKKLYAESKPMPAPKDRFDSIAVHVVGGKVYVAKTFNSYGIPLTQLNIVDGKISETTYGNRQAAAAHGHSGESAGHTESAPVPEAAKEPGS